MQLEGHGYRKLSNNRRVLPFLIICILLSLFPSCEQLPIEKRKTSPYMDSMILVISRIADTSDPLHAQDLIDSVYHSLPAATLIDRFNYYEQKCIYYSNNMHRYSIANNYADSMIWLIENRRLTEVYPVEYSRAFYSKGDVKMRQKNYSEAYKYFFKARQVGQKSLDLCSQSEYSYRLGMVRFRQGHFNYAVENFKQALDEWHSCKEDFYKYYRNQELCNNIGLSFYKAGRYDSALKYYNAGMAFIASEKSKFPDRNRYHEIAEAVLLGNKADIYVAKGNTVQAEKLLRKSIETNSAEDYDNRDALFARLKLANLYMTQKRIPELQKTLDNIKAALDKKPDDEVRVEWLKQMWLLNDMKADIPSAYSYHKSYQELQDKLSIKDRGFRETDLEEELKNLESQYQIEMLHRESNLRRMYLVVTLIFVFMTMLILFLLLQNFRKSRENVKELTVLNDQISIQKSQLEVAVAELANQNREKDRILRVVAHDLRNPIGGVAGFVDLMLREDHHNEETREILVLLKNACADSLQLINELLTASGKSVKANNSSELLDLNALISQSVDLIRYKAEEKEQIILTTLPVHQVHVKGNREKISRLMSNLITNAIKFSLAGSVIQINLEKRNGMAVIEVRDQGIGIPEHLKDKIFDMFTVARRSGTAGEQPYGLGLSICKQIVQEHKGQISFNSETGSGTTFIVRLPAQEA